MVKKERRRAPRAKAKVPLEIKSDRRVIEGRTRDISISGAYLTLDQFVPLNTELSVSIFLPGSKKTRKARTRRITCHGVVVRNEAVEEVRDRDGYGVALCFTDLTKGDKKKLAEYVKQKLPLKEKEKLMKAGNRMGSYDPGKVFSTGISGKREVRISSANFRVMGDEIRLSRNGICCRTDRDIPLFREIAVNLVFPPSPKDRREKDSETLQCSAVVVGCEKIARSTKYNLSAYFIGLSREQKARLEDCIKKIF